MKDVGRQLRDGSVQSLGGIMLKYAIIIVVLMSFNCGHSSSSDSKTELNSTNLKAIKKLEKKAKQKMDCEPLGFQFIELSN